MSRARAARLMLAALLAAGCRMTPAGPPVPVEGAPIGLAGSWAAVRGSLAPYWHPACDCRAVGVFEGELDGDRIAGRFVTRRESGGAVLSEGSWQVRRPPG